MSLSQTRSDYPPSSVVCHDTIQVVSGQALPENRQFVTFLADYTCPQSKCRVEMSELNLSSEAHNLFSPQQFKPAEISKMRRNLTH